MSAGVLLIISTPLGSNDVAASLSPAALATIRTLECFVAEEAKSARAFLKAVGMPKALSELAIETLNEHTDPGEVARLLAPLLAGRDVGLLSEAGYPAVADPGSNLIASAHVHGVKVVPLIGPSSIVLALAASGLNGQQFCFHGYLPVPEPDRTRAIVALEARSVRERATQLFIEAPYRNDQMLQAVLAACRADTLLCVASDLSLPGETICTNTIAQWRAQPRPQLDRRPSVFLLQAAREAFSAGTGSQRRAAAPRRTRSRTGARSARPGSPSA